MKRILLGTAIALTVTASALYLFREPIIEAIAGRLTADMFVAADTDAFDPGLAIEADFPPLRAIHAGVEIRSIEPFAGSRGTVFIANRSVDW